MKEIILKGVPAASGIAQGSTFILDKQDFIIPPLYRINSILNSLNVSLDTLES